MEKPKFAKRIAYTIDRMIESFSPQLALQRRVARYQNKLMLEAMSRQYRGADRSRLRHDWVLGREDEVISNYELQTLRRRSYDLARNEPIAAGAINTYGVNIVGNGLQPQSQINAEELGISKNKAEQHRRDIERVWKNWSKTADHYGRLTFSEIQFLVLREIILGEAIVLPTWSNDSWRPIKRTLQVVSPSILSTQSTRDGTITNGVECDAAGRVTRYLFETNDIPSKKFSVPLRDAAGRFKIYHLFPTTRPGQLRGIPLLAPVINLFKDFAGYLESEVVAARVAACVGVCITKQDPGYGLPQSDPITGQRLRHLEPGMMYELKVGEDIRMVDPNRPGETFDPFVERMIRMIGIALNLPYELIALDFSKTNYSSARAALLEARRHFANWRYWLAWGFCQLVFELVIEEAYLAGLLDLPGFYTYRDYYCRADWVGGSYEWVDPYKEARATEIDLKIGRTTFRQLCLERGLDWEEQLAQMRAERAAFGEAGIPWLGQEPETEKDVAKDTEDNEIIEEEEDAKP